MKEQEDRGARKQGRAKPCDTQRGYAEDGRKNQSGIEQRARSRADEANQRCYASGGVVLKVPDVVAHQNGCRRETHGDGHTQNCPSHTSLLAVRRACHQEGAEGQEDGQLSQRSVFQAEWRAGIRIQGEGARACEQQKRCAASAQEIRDCGQRKRQA